MTTDTGAATTLLPGIPKGATLYQRAVSNAIGVTPATSNSLGYLATNKSQLEVVSQLTGQDPINIYNFTFQNNGKVEFNLIGIDGASPVRVQLYDGTGTRLLADSQGTLDQQASYKELQGDGMQLNAGKYVVKVTYGKDGNKTQPQNYALQIGSGNTFQADYRTLGRPTSIQATLLSGGSLGYNPLSATAALLTAQSQGTALNVFGVLSQFPTNIFA